MILQPHKGELSITDTIRDCPFFWLEAWRQKPIKNRFIFIIEGMTPRQAEAAFTGVPYSIGSGEKIRVKPGEMVLHLFFRTVQGRLARLLKTQLSPFGYLQLQGKLCKLYLFLLLLL